jgi:hypothetical protein
VQSSLPFPIRLRTLVSCVIIAALIVGGSDSLSRATTIQRRIPPKTVRHARRADQRHSRRAHHLHTRKGKTSRLPIPGAPSTTKTVPPIGSAGSAANTAPVTSTTTTWGGTTATQTVGTTTTQLFSPTSVWNEPLSPTAAIDPNSAAMVSGLASQAVSEYRQGIGPDIGTNGTTTVYQVGPNQPTVLVSLSNPTLWWRVSLQSAFDAVPIPANAQPAAGSDAEMTIWQHRPTSSGSSSRSRSKPMAGTPPGAAPSKTSPKAPATTAPVPGPARFRCGAPPPPASQPPPA